MPFPPGFTDAWDETQPPDTQPANLLGADLRNLKTDIRQRMSLISGTLANRPTPEDIFGTANYGLVYFSTDTQQMFQWQGTALGWVDITSTFFHSIADFEDATTHTLNGADGDLNNITIPAGLLGVGSFVEVEAYGIITPGPTLGATASIMFGGTSIVSASVTTTARYWLRAIIENTGVSVQRCGGMSFNPTQVSLGSGAFPVAGAENTANPVIVKVRAVHFDPADVITCQTLHVRVRR